MKYALRQLAKSPGFTAVALATLALGIGVNTTAFTALNRLLFYALPFPEPERVVQVWGLSARQDITLQTPGDYIDECDGNTVFEDMAAYVRSARASLAEPGQPPAQCFAVRVTANFFPLFGLQAQRGRLPTDAEDRHLDPIAVVSNLFWREHYGSDPGLVGRTVTLNSKAYTIVGILSPKADDPDIFGGWPAFVVLDGTRANAGDRSAARYHVAARLKPGATLVQAQTEMDGMAKRFAHDYPDANTGKAIKVLPYPTNHVGPTGTRLTWLVMALCGMVLLIACVNLANLQLVRSTGNAREIAVRLALGCSRWGLIRLQLLECIVISVAGGALGLLLARWSTAYVARFFDEDMPLNWKVLAFTFAASLLTAAVFGTVPAFIASRTDINETLKRGSRGATSDRSRRWLRQGLVVVELALALTLLAGAGFFVAGIYKLTHEELGWHADNAIVGSIELDHDHFGEQLDPRSLAFGDRLLAELRALPGVEAAALSVDSPAWGLQPVAYRVEGRPRAKVGQETLAGATPASPGYLQVYGIRLLQGRDFNEADRPGSPPVVIVNEAMARKCWPGENPIGKRIGPPGAEKGDLAEVVGVMADFKGAADFYNPKPDPSAFLRPWAQNSHRYIVFNIRTSGDPRAFKETVRKALARLAPNVAANELRTVMEVKDSEVRLFTFMCKTLLWTSILGLLLAAVGIYGVVAQIESERTKEIGIRMALGAQPAGLVWLFLRNGIVLALVGSAIGLGASFYLINFLSRTLPNLPGNEPGLVAAVAGILIAVAVLACWLPARRATQVSPVVALRAE